MDTCPECGGALIESADHTERCGECGWVMEGEPEEGDEGPSYGVSLREQQIQGYEMDRNPNDPRW